MAQYLVTEEIGVQGRNEKERRHFPEEGKVHSTDLTYKYKPSGRVYIHPGYGTQPNWKPHGKSINIKYSNNGPDWESMLRYIPSPRDQGTNHPECLPTGQRSFPEMTQRTYEEWTYYPENYNTGKQCFFKDLNRNSEMYHLRNLTSTNEISHSIMHGKRRKYHSIWQKREFPYSAPGDKVYQVVEYSPNFHKGGSSRPVVNFGGPPLRKPDTFVPLQQLPEISRDPYVVKERRRRILEDVDAVKKINSWKPAPPLISPDKLDLMA